MASESHPPYHLLPELLHHQRVRTTPIKTEASSNAQRLTFDDGSSVFAKFATGDRPAFLAAEIQGLRWLRQATTSVVEVLYADNDLLVEPWLCETEPNREAAHVLGRELAHMHQAGAEQYGAPWRGYIGELDLDNTPVADRPWGEWYVEYRLLPYLRMSQDNGALDSSDIAHIEKLLDRLHLLSGPDEPPSRIHGDLWFGNILWTAAGARLIDPSAHGGHRETDLANMRLWGSTPFVDEIVSAYEEIFPLENGWFERLGIHQLYPLLAHTALFGMQYRQSLMSVVRRYVGDTHL